MCILSIHIISSLSRKYPYIETVYFVNSTSSFVSGLSRRQDIYTCRLCISVIQFKLSLDAHECKISICTNGIFFQFKLSLHCHGDKISLHTEYLFCQSKLSLDCHNAILFFRLWTSMIASFASSILPKTWTAIIWCSYYTWAADTMCGPDGEMW